MAIEAPYSKYSKTNFKIGIVLFVAMAIIFAYDGYLSKYDSIQQIDKTYFEKKGFFMITYKDKHGKEVRRKLNERTYDNLAAILEHLVAKISA